MMKWLWVIRHPKRYWQYMSGARQHNKEVYRRGNMHWVWWRPTGCKVSDRWVMDNMCDKKQINMR
jgi:hypothetical protein